VRTQWLPPKRAALKPSTYFRYERMSETYLLPHLGRVPPRALASRDLERLYAHLLAAGGANGKPLAPKTVLNVHQIVRKALGDALRKGLVTRNVALAVDPPRGDSEPGAAVLDRGAAAAIPAGSPAPSAVSGAPAGGLRTVLGVVVRLDSPRRHDVSKRWGDSDPAVPDTATRCYRRVFRTPTVTRGPKAQASSGTSCVDRQNGCPAGSA
jgi:hypothetical protein